MALGTIVLVGAGVLLAGMSVGAGGFVGSSVGAALATIVLVGAGVLLAGMCVGVALGTGVLLGGI